MVFGSQKMDDSIQLVLTMFGNVKPDHVNITYSTPGHLSYEEMTLQAKTPNLHANVS